MDQKSNKKIVLDLDEETEERKGGSSSDWSFTVTSLDIRKIIKNKTASRNITRPKKKGSLALENKEQTVNQKISRRQMAQLEDSDDIRSSYIDQDDYANPFLRLLAFAIDLTTLGLIIYFIKVNHQEFNSLFVGTPLEKFLDHGIDIDYTPFLNFVGSMNPQFKFLLIENIGTSYVSNNMSVLFIFGIIFFSLYLLPLSVKGKSIGMKLMNIELVNEEGKFLNIFAIIFRQIIFLPISVLTLMGPLFVFFNKKSQGLHDLLAKSFVRNLN